MRERCNLPAIVGSRLLEIGNLKLADVNALVDPLITRDNAFNAKAKRTLHFGDVASFDLPNSGLGVRIPTIYWEYTPPGDPRLAIAPDIAVDTTASDYFDDRDPVLRAVLDL